MRHTAVISVTIPNGQTDSDVYLIPRAGESIVDFVVYTPAALTGTVKLYMGPSQNSSFATDMAIVELNGSDVTLTAARAIPLPISAFKAIGVKSSIAEGAARTFKIVVQFEVSL